MAGASRQINRIDHHISSFAPLSVWLRLVLRNGGVPRPYWGRLARVLALSAACAPLRLAEAFAYSRKVDAAVIAEAPLFVLGLARTGTTELHTLLAQDPALGCVDNFQALVPTFSLVGRGWLRRLMERGVGEQKRPMDNMTVSLATPQEEDIALANSSPRSAVHQLTFPKLGPELRAKYALMGWAPPGEVSPGPLSEREASRWQHEYLRIVRKANIHAEGRRLVLKSPANLGRVDHLLRLFPNAKFVHIVRNPYVVYASLRHMVRVLLPLYQMDDCDLDRQMDLLADYSANICQKYQEDRSRIPAGNLAELRFEDLERNPLGELERLYSELDLPGWTEAAPAVRDYVGTLTQYRKNTYDYDQATLDRVREQWGFAVEGWGYDYDAPPSSAA